ncbi:MAG: hypothetical protein D6729_04070 [Deltaproteobacteria bacterium]|nr:MAG: hypothetical protein D6729_04070 [Deltaproteobacteria bacterium]
MKRRPKAARRRGAAVSLVLLGGLAAGCGGSWSNEDLLFLQAVPERTRLESTLPGTRPGEQSQSLERFLVGESSELREWTLSASQDFNAGLFEILSGLEEVRRTPPTRRERDRRIWGPFPHPTLRRFDLKVEIERRAPGEGELPYLPPDFSCAGPVFVYAASLGPRGEARWARIITGLYCAKGGLRRGEGFVAIHPDRIRALGLPTPDTDELARVLVHYRTDAYPILVDMVFTPRQGTELEEFSYHYRRYADGEGALQFNLSHNILGPAVERWQVTAGWRPDGSGRGQTVVSEGDLAGPETSVECWDARGIIGYELKTWEGSEEGDPSACPALRTFE